jgi:hypothetical protein
MATPSPMSTTRNWTTGETSATAVSASSGTNVVMIATKAMSSGTTAVTEPKTKTRTSSAPKPPISASASTPGPSLPPLSSLNASNPVTRTGCPATVRPRSARVAAWAAAGFSPQSDPAAARGYASAKTVRPSLETNARLPVEANDAIRAPGSARRSRVSTAASCRLIPGAPTVVPAGSLTTGRSGLELPSRPPS